MNLGPRRTRRNWRAGWRREEGELLAGIGGEVSNPSPQCRGHNVFQDGVGICSGLSRKMEEGTKKRNVT